MLRPHAVRHRIDLRLLIRAAAGDGVDEAEAAVGLAVGGEHLVAHALRHRAVATATAEVGHRHTGRADKLGAEERHLRLHLEPQESVIALSRAVKVKPVDGAVPVWVFAAVGVRGRLLPAAAEGHGRVERWLLEGDEGLDPTAADGSDGDAPA